MKTHGNEEVAARTGRGLRDAGRAAQPQAAPNSHPAATARVRLEDLASRSPKALQLQTRAALTAVGPAALKLQGYQRMADSSAVAATAPTDPVQRKIKVGTISVTKHNFEMHCERERGKLYAAWNALTHEQRARLEPLIKHDDLMGEGGTFLDVLEARATAAAAASSSSGGATGATPSAPETFDVPTAQGPIRMRILNDSGGYHLILEHPMRRDMVIRHRKDAATPINQGLANLQALQRALRRRGVEAVRPPAARRYTDNAYEVERVDSAVDGLALWRRLQGAERGSDEHTALARQIRDIRDMFIANIEAAHQGESEPFPDFRPANVGVKAGDNELVYIDFDQPGEVKDLDTLADQAMEWAGRRYEADPGGSRDADPEFFKFVTGELLQMPPQDRAGRGQKRRNAASNYAEPPSPAATSSSRATPVREEAPHEPSPATSSSVTAVGVRAAEETLSNEEEREGQSKKRRVEVSEHTYVLYQGYHWTPDFAHWYDHERRTWRDRIEEVAPSRRYDWYEERYL